MFDPAGFERALPPSVAELIAICDEAGIALAIYGGSITDSMTGHRPNDHDLYVGATLERFLSAVVPRMGLVPHRYGDYIQPSRDVFYCKARDGAKIDLLFLGEKPRLEVDELYALEEGLRPGCVTIKSFVFFPRERRFVDPFSGIDDLRAKILRPCVRAGGPLDAPFVEKTFAILYSYLHGKYPDFRFTAGVVEAVADFFTRRGARPSYFDAYPWRLGGALIQVLRFDAVGLAAVLEYWGRTGLDAIFLPELAGESAAREMRDALLRGPVEPIERLALLDRVSGHRLKARMRAYAFPVSYLETIPAERLAILKSFLDG